MSSPATFPNIPSKETSNGKGQRKEGYDMPQAVTGKGKVASQPIFNSLRGTNMNFRFQ
jgi:hypothetical protein